MNKLSGKLCGTTPSPEDPGMSTIRSLLTAVALLLSPSVMANGLLGNIVVPVSQLPVLSSTPMPDIIIPGLPPIWVPVIPIGPPLQGSIPINYNGTGVIVHYDNRSNYPIRLMLTGIVGSPP